MKESYAFLVVMFAPILAFSGQTELMSCTGTSAGGVAHSLEIETQSGEVTRFSYTSLVPTGDTCDISAKRDNKKSRWSPQGDGLVIETFSLGEESGKVFIKRLNDSYSLKVLSELSKSCGMGGYLSPIVILHNNTKVCELKNM